MSTAQVILLVLAILGIVLCIASLVNPKIPLWVSILVLGLYCLLAQLFPAGHAG